MLLLAGCRYNLRVRLYRPRSASLLQSFTSWLTGMPAEFSDPKFPSYGEGREGENPQMFELLNSDCFTWGCRVLLAARASTCSCVSYRLTKCRRNTDCGTDITGTAWAGRRGNCSPPVCHTPCLRPVPASTVLWLWCLLGCLLL
jgi:hypothetical protein